MPHTVAHLDRLASTAEAAAARDQLYRRRPPGQRGVQRRRGPRRAQDRTARRVVAGSRSGRGEARARRVRRDHSGRGIGLRGGVSGQIPGGGRRPAFADPQVAGVVGPGRGAAPVGDPQALRDRPVDRLVEVHWSKGAEAYVTPVADDCVGVAILSSSRGGFDRHFEAFGELRDRVRATPTVRTGRRTAAAEGQ